MVNVWFQVALGGAIGAMGRFGLGRIYGWDGQGWPLHTLAVNVLGGLGIGVLASLFSLRGWHGWEGFLIVGLLGGFTTFSAFSLEVWHMFEQAKFLDAFAYASVSVIASLGAVALGVAAIRYLA